MDNKKETKVYEGIKVLPLSRMTTAIFNATYNAIDNEGEIVTVSCEIPNSDAKKIVISRVVTDGVTQNKQLLGKVTEKDVESNIFSELSSVIEQNRYIAELYGVDGNTILLRVKEKEGVVDVSSGFSPDVDVLAKAEKIVGKEGLDERIEYLKQHGITKGSLLYKKIIENIREGELIKKPVALYKKVGKGMSLIQKVFSNIVVGNYPILQGPKSVGKNVCWESIAWVLNCKIITLQCSERLTRADMLGFQSSDSSVKELLTEEGLKFKLEAVKSGDWSDEAIAYQNALDKSNSPDLKLTPGPVTQAIEMANAKQGVILLVDEMNLADANTLAGVFNTLTDHHSDSLFITGYGRVSIPRDLIIGATQNANTGNYTGVNTQNTATISRFTCIDIKETGGIKSLLERVAREWNVGENILLGMDKVYKEFKKLAEDGEDSISADSLNIRGFESAVRLVGIGVSAKEAVIEGVINTVTDYEEIEVLTQQLDNFVDKDGNFI